MSRTKLAFWLLLAVASVGVGIVVGNGYDIAYGVGAGIIMFGVVGMITWPIMNDPWL